MKKMIVMAAALSILCGCARLSPWVPVKEHYAAPNAPYSVDLPEGWMRLNSDENLLITRDGIFLQSILIEGIRTGQALAHSKKALRRDMKPEEAAESVIGDVKSDKGLKQVEVVDRASATVAGYPGFKFAYTFTVGDGMKYRGVYYGFMKGDRLYGLRYLAADRHYYDQDLKTFEKVLKSFRLS